MNLIKPIKLFLIPLFTFISQPSFSEDLFLQSIGLTLTPADPSVMLGFECSACSSDNPLTFTMSIFMSTNTSCTNSKIQTYPNTVINSSQTYYLLNTGLTSYAMKDPDPMTGIQCVRLSTTGNSSVLALVSGTPYARYFPADTAPVLSLS